MPRRCQLHQVVYLVLGLVAGVVLTHTLLSLVLPTPWADTDLTHLFRVVLDQQNFQENRPLPLLETGDADGGVQANLDIFVRILQSRNHSYREYYDNLKRLESMNQKDARVRRRTELVAKFRPLLSAVEFSQLVFTLDTFVRACTRAGLVYFLLEASLMGSIRHHGLIPWDDDIDVVMSAKQWRRAREYLGNIQGFELYTPVDSQWKLYMSSARAFLDRPFKFPYLDIFFYAEDSTHIWALTRGLKHDLVYRKSDIFPLTYRPFEHLTVPVPCNLDLVVHKSHPKEVCVTPEYIHKTNQNVHFRGTVSVPCRVLHDLYPFVFTKPSTTRFGFVDEFLKVGTRVLQQKTLPAGCGHDSITNT